MAYDEVYDAVYDLYDPDTAWDEMVTAGTEESMNVAEEALWRHADRDETGLRLVDFESGEAEEYSFAELAAAAGEVGHFLEEHTDYQTRVGAMLPAQLELYATVFGTIGSGRVYVPLAPLYGVDAMSYRLADAGAEVLVTNATHLEKVDPERLPDLETVVVVDGTETDSIGHVDVVSYDAVSAHDDSFDVAETHPGDMCVISYTSGTTGQPKGCPTRHGQFVKLNGYFEYAVDLRPSDNYFVAASPAWAYGLNAGTLAAGFRGTAVGCYRGEFEPARLLETFERFEVTNAMVPPTGLRYLRSSDVDVESYDVDLRVLISAGEALDEATVNWCERHLGTRPQDAYGQTETGMIVCNYPFGDWEVKPGSMGKPLPGKEVRLLDDDGSEVATDEVGEIAVERRVDDRNEYWGKPEPSVESFSGNWLRTGDLARRDDDGYYWYVGRKDSVIISSGYRIGPEEVEETLVKHDAVDEVGVVGAPDETRGNVVKAYVTASDDALRTEETKEALTAYAREELSAHEYPRRIEFVDELPRTASGKVKRGVLEDRAAESN